MISMALAILVFIFTYLLIATERFDRTVVAMAGGLAMIFLGVISQEEAFAGIDLNVIFLLVGMMVIADIMRRTGVFQWMAVRTVKLARGNPYLILILLSTVTAVVSAFLDNVTTVVLVAPMSLFLSTHLRISPLPFLISAILASNIGGSATLIGDPPNILIGSAAGLDFLAFILNLAPVAAVVLVVALVTVRVLFDKDLTVDGDLKERLMELDESDLITDPQLLRKALAVLCLVILGFVLHGSLGFQLATVALAGAAALMLWGRQSPGEVLREVEWGTLFFLIGLFMVVEGVVKVGLTEALARGTLSITGDNALATSLLVMWLSALVSGVIGNIPLTTTMIPIVRALGDSVATTPVWWSLALGACLGGNLTLVAAAANVIIANIAGRSGYPVTFGHFLKYGVIVTLESLVISSAYVWLRYLR